MTTVTICISSVDQTKTRMHRAFDGKPQGAYISFPSVELLWKVITPRRWEMLKSWPVLVRSQSVPLPDGWGAM